MMVRELSASHAGGTRAGAILGGVRGSPMWLRICCNEAYSVTKAMIRIAAAHLGQVSGNTS